MKIPNFIRSEHKQQQSRARNLRLSNAALQSQSGLQQLLLTENCRFTPQKSQSGLLLQTPKTPAGVVKASIDSTPKFLQFKSAMKDKETPIVQGRYTKSGGSGPKRLQQRSRQQASGVSAKPASYALRSSVIAGILKKEAAVTPTPTRPALFNIKSNNDPTPIKFTFQMTPVRVEDNKENGDVHDNTYAECASPTDLNLAVVETPVTATPVLRTQKSNFSLHKLTKFVSRSALKVLQQASQESSSAHAKRRLSKRLRMRRSVGSDGNSSDDDVDSSSSADTSSSLSSYSASSSFTSLRRTPRAPPTAPAPSFDQVDAPRLPVRTNDVVYEVCEPMCNVNNGTTRSSCSVASSSTSSNTSSINSNLSNFSNMSGFSSASSYARSRASTRAPTMGITATMIKRLRQQQQRQGQSTGSSSSSFNSGYSFMSAGMCSMPGMFLIGMPAVFHSTNLITEQTQTVAPPPYTDVAPTSAQRPRRQPSLAMRSMSQPKLSVYKKTRACEQRPAAAPSIYDSSISEAMF